MNDLDIIVYSFVFGMICGLLELKYNLSQKLKYKTLKQIIILKFTKKSKVLSKSVIDKR